MPRCGALSDDLRHCRRAEGHEGEHSPSPRGTTLRNFRCDNERWQMFLDACRENNTDGSAQIRDMIDLWLDAQGIAPPADSFLYPSK